MDPRNAKILVIEDNDPDFRLVTEYLKEDAIPLSAIAHGTTLAEGLKIMEREDLGVVISDLDLPDSRGLLTLAAIVEKRPQLPVVVVTGFNDVKLGGEALQKGAQDFLVKGHFQSETLSRSIRYAIERKEIEKERQTTIEFLRLVNQSKGTRELIESATTFFQKRSGCDAVGIRMKKGDDYPYFEARGFPEEFVQAENSLCSRDPGGALVRDTEGNPVLECLCGNVICGRFDPSKPFFTKRGSFWTNSTTELLASTSEADRQARTRNRCNGEGYESVALLPLHTGHERVGLLQLNARRKGAFSPQDIDRWELLADSLAAAVVKFRAEEALAAERGNLQTIFDAVNVGMLLIDGSGAVQRVNNVISRWLGKEPLTICGVQPGNILGCVHALSGPAGCGHTPHCRTCVIRKTFETVLSSAQPLHDVETEATLRIGEDQVRLYLSLSADPVEINGKPHVILAVNNITSLKLAEQALRESEERLRTLGAATFEGIVFSEDGIIFDANEQAARIYGYPWNEVIGKPVLELIMPEDQPRVKEALQKGQENLAEYTCRRKDGSKFIAEARGRTVDWKNKRVRITAMRDITERKAAEEALRRSREDLARAQAVGQVGSWRLDIGQNILTWSDENHRMLGVPEGTPLTYETFLGVIHPDDRQNVNARWKAAMAGEPYDLEHRVVVNGQVKWVREKAYLEFDDKGKLVGGFGITQDITERKKAEEELKKLNRTLKAMSASSQAMGRAVDETEYLKEVCRIIVEECGYFLVWIGYAERDVAKTVRPVAFHGFDQAYIDSLKITWGDTERGHGPTGMTIRTGKLHLCRDIQNDPDYAPWRKMALERGFRSSLVLPLDGNDGVMGALNIYAKDPDAFSDEEIKLLTDLTNDLGYGLSAIRLRNLRKQAEEILRRDKETFERLVEERTGELMDAQSKLAHAKRLSDIGTLAATIAHELRTPLGVIRMGAYNIKKKSSDPSLLKHTAHIEKEVLEANQIISNLLFYARIKMPQCKRMPVFGILDECSEVAEKRFSSSKVSLERKFNAIKEVLAEVDELQIKEVFNNLLLNAYEALDSREGRIIVSAEHDEAKGRVFVRFEDNGPGILPENLPKLFEPFFTTKSMGTGLGLAVCRQIIENHRGNIEVASRKDEGTVFTVALPTGEGPRSSEIL